MALKKSANGEFEKKNKLPKWAIVLIVVLSISTGLPMVFTIGLFGYAIINDEVNGKKVEKDLVINYNVSTRYDEDYSAYIVTGYITNNGDDSYYGIDISYNLYDKDNNIIGEATDYLEELDEGKTWKFSAEYYGMDIKDIARIEFNDIDADDEFLD